MPSDAMIGLPPWWEDVVVVFKRMGPSPIELGQAMTAATITAEPIGPISPSQQQQVTAAVHRARKIRKAAAVAGFNGWTTGILAVCSAPFAALSLPGLLITAGMSLVACNEFQGRRRLLQFDGEAPAFLGWNQVGFMALIAAYCSWMLVVGLTGEGRFAAEFAAKPELRAAFDSVDELDETYRVLMAVVYGAGIALSVIFQGWNAIYYFTRRKHVQAYVQKTPAWVIDLQRLSLPT